jgi:hypothetical protein
VKGDQGDCALKPLPAFSVYNILRSFSTLLISVRYPDMAWKEWKDGSQLRSEMLQLFELLRGPLIPLPPATIAPASSSLIPASSS